VSADGPVAINARAAVRDELGGVERYARELALRLPALRPARYRVIVPRRRLRHRAGHAWEQLVLPAASGDAELIYSPANVAPVLSSRNVVVIHDLAALVHPEAYSTQYVAYQQALLPRLAHRARHLITVSEFSRGELAARLRISPDRISVIPGGVDAERFSDRADAATAARSLGLNHPYVLAVGTASARKNHAALEPAARELRRRGIELVVAGSVRAYLRAGWPAGSAGATDAAPEEETSLRRVGYVPDGLLPGLYAGALALAMPSLHEGFGLPCLEAMACGTPVVAARAGALPETCGDAATLVDPADADGFAQALLGLAHGGGPERERLIAAGRKRVANFTWEHTTRRTDLLLTDLLT